MPNQQYDWLLTFEGKVRGQIATDVQNVFISWEGKPLRSGTVSDQLYSLFLKAGIYGDKPRVDRKRLCANHIRRSISTAIRDKNMGTSEKQNVADLMCHAVETADRHYYIRKKLESAPEAENIVRSVLYGEKQRSETEQNASNEDICVTPVKGMPCIPAGGNTHRLSTPKRRYTEDEEIKIHDAVPTRTSLRELSVGTHIERLLTELSVSPTQLYNKVRSMERYSPRRQGRKRTTRAQIHHN